MTASVLDFAAAFDHFIDAHLARLEQQLRAAQAATGPEDEAALDVPPDPEAPWQRITVEHVVLIEQQRLELLRDQLLAVFARV